MRKFGIAAALSASALVVAAVLLVGVAPRFSGAADHLDAPSLMSPGGDGRLDINDVYAFQSPANPANTVLIMTVNPFAGASSPTTLRPGANYEFLIDTDGDAVQDIRYRLKASAPRAAGVQNIMLHKATGAAAAGDGGGPKIAKGKSGTTIPVHGGGSLRVDVYDDPFFFDLLAFLGTYPFCSAPGGPPGSTGSDAFAGSNVTAIVLEVPSSALGPDSIGVWGRTVLDGAQIDRLGRPAINTVFIPSASKDAFNAGEPKDDVSDFSSFLGAFAGLLLPDILTVDTSSTAGFLNGRQLADDVIDIELSLIGVAPGSDCVDANDVPFLTTFPYLAPAH